MDKDKDLDNIFKKGLQNPEHSAYMEDDWDAMEQMLDKQKKRPAIIYWLPILGSVAALLLLVIGWWLLKPVTTQQQKNQQEITAIKKTQLQNQTNQPKNTGISGGTIQQVAVSRQTAVPPTIIANNLNTNRRNLNNKLFLTSSADGRRRDTTGTQNSEASQSTSGNLLAYNPKPLIQLMDVNNNTIAAMNVLPETPNSALIANKPAAVKSKPKSAMFNHPQFALNVLASSDLNGVNSLQQTKVGNNFGLLFSAGVFKKFTITTGAVYSAKPYMTGFANYHTAYQFKTEPLSVQANCRMLDIPLNIDYQVYNHYQNKISIGTGLSSYLMLHESYTYNYAEYGTGPASYNVPNPGKYFFSTLNLQATYERRINSKFGLTIEPYAKLPLSTVGVSQVRLQTTGVAVGLKWNLNSH